MSFTVGANGASDQRSSYITLGRQSTPVVQKGAESASLTLGPGYGTGASAPFTLDIHDPAGFRDVLSTILGIASACTIEVQTGLTPTLTLSPSSGSDSQSISLSDPTANISNSACAVSSAGTSITGSGNELRVSVQVAFSPAVAGAHTVLASVSTVNRLRGASVLAQPDKCSPEVSGSCPNQVFWGRWLRWPSGATGRPLRRWRI